MTPSLRFRILERDGFRCRYCGKAANEGATLHVDHIHPVAHGGSDEEDNLVTACSGCNLGKSARLLGVTEQPVVFRGKTRVQRRRESKGRKYPVADLSIERWDEGSHCATPLMVAVMGMQFGISSYRQTWEYLNRLGVGQLPPYRVKDAQWFRLLKAETEFAAEMERTLVQSLERAA